MSTERKIMLRSSDEEMFEVEESVALMSQTLKHMIEDNCADQVIPIPNVTGRILAKVIEYGKRQVANAQKKVVVSALEGYEEKKRWETNFLKVDLKTIVDLIKAANYLDIVGLLNLTCDRVAEMIMKGKTPEDVRRTFNIKNDFTPEEEKVIRREHYWAFDE